MEKLTAKKRLEMFREILSKYNPGEYLNKIDFEVCYNLFSNHYSWKQKEGVGIDKIYVIKDSWNKKAFKILRVDGSFTDISIIMASRGKKSTIKERLNCACRQAILPLIFEEKNKVKWGIQRCPFTGEVLTYENCHIDHYDWNFKEVFEEWLKTKDINLLELKLNNSEKDNVTYDIFEDEEIQKDFILFHNLHTHLRAISNKANLSRKKYDK